MLMPYVIFRTIYSEETEDFFGRKVKMKGVVIAYVTGNYTYVVPFVRC